MADAVSGRRSRWKGVVARTGVLFILAMAGVPLAAWAAESFAVIAVGDPPAGADADLAELTHQLRAACRDRVGNVLDVPTMQARLLGQSAGATLSELDRAYGGALAVYQNGEFDSAVRTLRAIVEDIETLPEGREPYQQWIRAVLRFAHAAATIGRDAEADAALVRLLRVEPNFRPDADQYSPTYRRRLDDLRARLRAVPQRRITVLTTGRAGSVFVEGRPSGSTPMTLFLPAGRYRIGGSAGSLRVPSFQVDVTDEDRTVVLDFETAEAIRVNAGPGLALPSTRRGEGLIRAGAWLDVDKLIVAARAFEGDAPFLVGAIYDVRRGAMLREGSVRTVAGSVPSVNIGALASFLLTGAQQREVRALTTEIAIRSAGAASGVLAAALPDLRPDPRAVQSASAPPPPVAPAVPPPRLPDGVELPRERSPALASRAWMRPAAWVAGGIAVGFTGLAVNQRLAANRAYDRADALLGPGGILTSSADVGRYRSLTAEGDASIRNTWVSAGVGVAFAAAAGLLGWASAGPAPAASF